MNAKQFTLLLIVAVLVGVLGLVVYLRRTAAWQTAGQSLGGKVLENFPANDVARVLVKDKDAELNLVKTDDRWRVRERHDYPADFTALSEFLREVIDLKFVQREPVGASLLPRLQLVKPGDGEKSGTLVEFQGKDGQAIASLLFGKMHLKAPTGQQSPFGDEGWPDGRYVMVGNDPARVGLIAKTFNNLEPKPEQWLNKDFFKIDGVRAVAVTTGDKTNDWRVTRDSVSAEFKLAGARAGEKLDSGKVAGLSSLLASPSFSDVLPPDAKPADTGLDKPVTARIETFDGLTYTIKLGKEDTNSNFHLQLAVSAKLPKERTPGADEKPEDKEKLDKEFTEKNQKTEEKLKQEKSYEKWVYLVSKWSVDQLLKKRPELLEEKKEEKAASESPGGGSDQ
jgi:hypothetical protein